MKIDQAKTRTPSKILSKNTFNKEKTQSINIFTENKRGEFYYLKIDNLIAFKMQARKNFTTETIDSLANTIKEHGIRQPLTVIKSPNQSGKFEIVSGERRYLAAKKIGLDKVPCIIIFDYNKAEEIALIENIQREDLHPIELGLAYKNLYESRNYNTHNDIAEKLGVTRTQVTEYLKFSELSQYIRCLLIKLSIKDRTNLRKIVNLENDEERESYIKEKFQDKILNSSVTKNSNIFSVNLKDGKINIKNFNVHNLDFKEKNQLKEILEQSIKKLNI